MNSNNRTRNSIINIIINFSYQFLIIFMTFLSRRVFIESLGVEYLGISGLFTNILGVLALMDLGLGGAMSFNMYKELVNNNKKRLSALNAYYKTLYNRIALAVLIVGVALLPFLEYIVNVENEIDNLHYYYILNLLNTVFSYLFVYKTTIVNADQKGYKLKIIGFANEVIKLIVQIFVLRTYHNYFLYLLIQVLFSLILNLVRSKFAEKWYPFIKEKAEIEEKDKKNIWENIKSMFYYKVGVVMLGNTDNILISILINTMMVGYYSNYTMIFNKIDGFISIFFNSILASIGNLNVTSTKAKKRKIFDILVFINNWLFTVACVGIFFIGEDFIIAISGDISFILSKEILIIGLIYFYIRGIQHPIEAFRVTTGLFKMAKFSMLICAISNIILSVVLGKVLGLFGIILATVISLLFTNVWYEPYLLFKKFFGSNPAEYYIDQIFKILLVIAIILLLYPIITNICIEHLYVKILLKIVTCFIVVNSILFFIYRKTDEFNFLMDKAKEILVALKNKIM